jgi:hypothetical protein
MCEADVHSFPRMDAGGGGGNISHCPPSHHEFLRRVKTEKNKEMYQILI